jgi:hypothetical protein
MKIQPVLIWFSAMLMLSPFSVHAENPSSPETKSDSCALFKPDDLTTLLGGTPVAKPNSASCIWTAAGSKSKLIVIKYANTGMAAEMAYMSARKNATKGGTVTDEAGLGDRAFARMESFGVSLVIIKQGQLLQLQYGAGVAGTAKDLDALLPVAKKAAAAF